MPFSIISYTQFYALLHPFYFSSSADHRYLHSFPTRRSSDLQFHAQRVVLQRVAAKIEAVHPGSMSKGPPPRSSSVSYASRSEEHTSELQSHSDLVCRLLLEKKNKLQLRYTTCP